MKGPLRQRKTKIVDGSSLVKGLDWSQLSLDTPPPFHLFVAARDVGIGHTRKHGHVETSDQWVYRFLLVWPICTNGVSAPKRRGGERRIAHHVDYQAHCGTHADLARSGDGSRAGTASGLMRLHELQELLPER